MLIERFQDERGAILWKYVELIEENDEKLGYMESVLSGKPILLRSMLESKAAADLFRCMKPSFSSLDEIYSILYSNIQCAVPGFAGFCDKFSGECLADDKGFLRVPISHSLPSLPPSQPSVLHLHQEVKNELLT